MPKTAGLIVYRKPKQVPLSVVDTRIERPQRVLDMVPATNSAHFAATRLQHCCDPRAGLCENLFADVWGKRVATNQLLMLISVATYDTEASPRPRATIASMKVRTSSCKPL